MRQIFVNLTINDVEKTKDFFSKLGFTFNPQFSDEGTLCMIIEENIFAMMMTPERMREFTKKEIADAHKVTEVINAINVDSREQVDEMVTKAIELGGKEIRDPKDHGWMYIRAIEDLDGHIWELLHAAAAPAAE